MTRLLVVGNARAGTASREAVQAAVAALTPRASVREASTGSVEELAEVLGSRQPDERLVVVGGDGSLHAAVSALDRLGRLDPADPVAVVPLGTGNDLARHLGIPLDPAVAAALALDGVPTALDVLAEAEGGDLVINAVHAGVGAEAARAAQPWKERLGAGGYAVGSALAGLTARSWKLCVELDPGTADTQVLSDGSEPVLMVGAGIGSSIGGGAPLAPAAVGGDGLIDVVVSAATGPAARLSFARDLRGGDHVDRTDVRTGRGRVLRVTGDPFRVNADGEISGPFTERTWTLRPRAWSLLGPDAGSALG